MYVSTNTENTKITAVVEESDTEGEEYVVITQARYESLLEDENWRLAVEAAGVDNWGGFDYAMDMLHSDED